MRDTFVRTLIDLAKKDKNIELITGDLGFGVFETVLGGIAGSVYKHRHSGTDMTTVAAEWPWKARRYLPILLVTFLRYAVWSRFGMTVLTIMPMLRLYV